MKYLSLAQLPLRLILYAGNCWVQFESGDKAKKQDHLEGLIFSWGVTQPHP